MNLISSVEISDIQKLNKDTYLLKLECPEIAQLARPGQFVMVHPTDEKTSYDPLIPRPYSIFALNRSGNKLTGITLLIKVLGRGGAAICAHSRGQRIQCTQPLGSGLDFDPDMQYVLVAGGTGIAPVAFAAREMQRQGIDSTILYGGKSEDAIFSSELKLSGCETIISTEDGSLGHKGLVTDLLSLKLENCTRAKQIFACGPWQMMAAIVEIASQNRTKCFVSLERYMACGIGVCLGCVYKEVEDDSFHTCCKEGPVVDGSKVDWNA